MQIDQIKYLEAALDSANTHIANLQQLVNLFSASSTFVWTMCSDKPAPPFETCLFLFKEGCGLNISIDYVNADGVISISKHRKIIADDIIAWINIDQGVGNLVRGMNVEGVSDRRI